MDDENFDSCGFKGNQEAAGCDAIIDQVDIQEVNKGISIEQKLDLYEAMDRLRPEYKMVIILKFFNDYKEKEIADLMELPLNTVKSHLRRAKEELNVLLKGGCFNE